MSVEEEYELARLRIKKNKPIIVPRFTKISLDSVAIEAGKKQGSIRKSRYPELYNRILKDREESESTPLKDCKTLNIKYRKDIEDYIVRLSEMYNRELMLLQRLEELESSLNERNFNVIKK